MIAKQIPCAALVVLMFSSSDASAAWHVWTVTETRRVLREDPAGENTLVSLSAARGEWESFQVLMRADEPVNGINLQASNLAGPNATVWQARDARLYRQHQLHLTDSTVRNDSFRPGWYPDALIPFRHPIDGESPGETPGKVRYTAVPFDLPAGETHGFWIDVYVRPDTVAGRYKGTWQVTSAGGDPIEIPVELEVWDFELPRVSTLVTALGSPAARMRSYYRQRAADGKEPEPEDWSAVETQCAELLSRHRINATPPGPLAPVAADDGGFRIPEEQIDALRAFVDRYHVNAISVPHPRSVVRDPQGQRDRLHAWLRAWDTAAKQLDRSHVLFFVYLKDEPNDPEAYHYVQQWGRAIREADSVVQVMVVEQTWTSNPDWGDLYGSVDIWCPLFSLHDSESAAKRLALGETVWTYTALCQRDPTPWWHTDFPLLNYRVPAWIAWRYRIQGLLYWGGMSHWRGVEDPWTDPKTLDRRTDGRGALYNGEGSLVYPGRAVGYDGIAPSLRLKALRDSIEDYEYMAILDRAGCREVAEQTVLPLAGSWYQWEQDPKAYEGARRQLAERILRLPRE